ncbi:MAG: hypothetical protein HY290_02005 [Planctomycetia bacterium]|nr:hypothetical protein [Planctomycetia bacterium]
MLSFYRMSFLRSAGTALVCAFALAGCSARGEMDQLEADLRNKEQAQEELTRQLAHAEEDLKVARSDAVALRKQLNRNRQVSLTEEQADVLYRAEAVKFNSLLTSGQNRDGQPGDEGLSVMLIPVDVHGDLVKLAGAVELELFDMSLEGEQQRLGQWTFTTDEVREHWHRGFISTGYLFQLDWQRIPSASELTLHAKLSIHDGRKFDATTQVKVDPPLPRSATADGGPGVRPAVESARRRKAAPAGKPAIVPASSTMKARRPAGLDAAAHPGEMPPVRKPRPDLRERPAREPADDPTRTSDRWTDETIPTLR